MYKCYACGKETEQPGEVCPFCKFPVISTMHGDIEEEKGNTFLVGDMMGDILGDIYSEKELAAVRRMLAVLKKHGKYPGISFGMTKEDEQRFWIDLGFRFISSGADYNYLRESALRNAGQLRSIVADRG